jgi:hypothetical protein
MNAVAPAANHLFAPLHPGPLDIIGDVHGELDALRDLLRALGYDEHGRHPGRRLAFIGDLCDRGPDSPGVIRFVRGLVEAGQAQCLLGNHELNVLRGAVKDGNGWAFTTDHDRQQGQYLDSAPLPEEERDAVGDFFGSLPLVLERADLRLVHAAWDDAAIALLRECSGPTQAIYRAYSQRASDIARDSGLGQRAASEWQAHGAGLTDAGRTPPLLEHVGRLDAHYQMANPMRILTSGPEALTAQPFFASGKWRMLERVRWWNRYRDPRPVLVGHYWRWPDAAVRADLTRGETDLFAGAAVNDWHGAERNVFCLDFAVGARHKERARGVSSGFRTRLGAVRWPERELLFDDGRRLPLTSAGGGS